MATTKTYKPNQLYAVPLADLQADPNQPRKYLDPQALEELTASVTQHGVLDPVLFRQDKTTGILYVVAGERHCAAARQINLSTVPETLSLTKLPQEIRDECRQDPTDPKNILVTLARNKEQRTMLSQYAKYKQQRAKAAGETAPATVRRNPAETLAAALEASGKKITAMGMNSLTGGDLTLVIEAMTGMKDTLENALSKVLK